MLCVDEKNQIQALNRTQPLLPMGLGYVEGVTHDYVRHGTTTLFAAPNIATGQVLTRCKRRHRHQEYLNFLKHKHVDASVPQALDIHWWWITTQRISIPGLNAGWKSGSILEKIKRLCQRISETLAFTGIINFNYFHFFARRRV